MAIKKLIEYLPPILQDFAEFKALFAAEQTETNGLRTAIEQMSADSFLDTASDQAVRRYEKILNINPTTGQSIGDRKSALIAKWRTVGKVNLKMLQNIADSWKNGEITVSFTDGKIKLTFVGEYGVPTNLAALKAALEEIKPAHLVIDYGFRYLLIREIHGVMTLTQIETEKLSKFAGGI